MNRQRRKGNREEERERGGCDDLIIVLACVLLLCLAFVFLIPPSFILLALGLSRRTQERHSALIRVTEPFSRSHRCANQGQLAVQCVRVAYQKVKMMEDHVSRNESLFHLFTAIAPQGDGERLLLYFEAPASPAVLLLLSPLPAAEAPPEFGGV